jgi:hypothetical protein
MTKDDLKTGDFVQRSDGAYGIIMLNAEGHGVRNFIIKNDGSYLDLGRVRSDMTHCESGYSLIKVYRGYCGEAYRSLKANAALDLALIWQREEEPEEVTTEEVCAKFGKTVKIVKEKSE